MSRGRLPGGDDDAHHRTGTPATFSALVTDFVVASVTVAPDSQMVFAGDRFKITARPKNKIGQVLPDSVKWAVGTTTVATVLDSLKQVMLFKAFARAAPPSTRRLPGNRGPPRSSCAGWQGQRSWSRQRWRRL